MIPLMYLSNSVLNNNIQKISPLNSLPTSCTNDCLIPSPPIISGNGTIIVGDYWVEQGGYYSGLFTLTGNEVYALILSPKAVGAINANFTTTQAIQAVININNVITTDYDGFKNTNDALNYAKTNNLMSYYPILTELDNKNKNNTNGFNDWYIPSQQEFTLLYKHCELPMFKNMGFLGNT